MSGFEGTITVRLSVADGRVAAVGVEDGRPQHPGRMFVGRPAAEVPAVLPVLFSLCGNAQLLAGLQALEGAGGMVPAAPHLRARRLMLAAETALEHASRILRDWCAFVSAAPDLAAIRGLRAALVGVRGDLYGGRDWARPGGGALAPQRESLRRRIAQARAIVDRAVFAGPAAAALADVEALMAWARLGGTPAARMVECLIDERLCRLGGGELAWLPALAPAAMAARLDADSDGGFLARPDWEGLPRLTHPLVRQAAHPLVAACGNGALALAVGRLVELDAALVEAEGLSARIDAAPAGDGRVADGEGIGMIEAARGLLVHRAVVADGRVARYVVLAPTAWNFHPGGALVHGLRGEPADDTLERRARLLAALIDPCVDFAVTITPSADEENLPRLCQDAPDA